VILPQIQIARAHWLLGTLFLVIIVEEYVPRRGPDGSLVRSRSLLVPWALLLGAAGVWATTVFADVVHDMLVHTLWGDILFAAGALELARRRGVYERPWLELVLPLTFLSTGLLFIFHVWIHQTAGDSWHLAMGALLIAGGVLELVRLRRPHHVRLRPRGTPPIPAALVPLAGFALALIAIPVAAAS
jgi:hypothetical protein